MDNEARVLNTLGTDAAEATERGSNESGSFVSRLTWGPLAPHHAPDPSAAR